MNKLNSTNKSNIKQIPNELKDFNWAAFLLTFVWGYKYKAWITFLAIPLLIFQLPLGLNWILLACLQLYCGINGNEWAYKQDYWKKSKDFRITQMKWAVAALTFYIIVPLLLLSLGDKFFRKTDNLSRLIENSQCLTAQKDLKKDIKNIDKGINSSNEQIIQQLAKIHHTTAEYGQVEVKTNNRPLFAQKYNLSVNKDETSQCNLINQNCSIVYTFSMPQYTNYITTCRFYFDNFGNTQADTQTQKAITKGINIFKYL